MGKFTLILHSEQKHKCNGGIVVLPVVKSLTEATGKLESTSLRVLETSGIADTLSIFGEGTTYKEIKSSHVKDTVWKGSYSPLLTHQVKIETVA